MSGDGSVWEGFESEFFGDSFGESLNETEPISGFRSTMAQNRQILKQIMDTLGNCTIQQDKDGYVYLTRVGDGYVDVVFFPEEFPHQSPRLKRRYSNNSISELSVVWNYQGDIYNDFINYYNQTIGL